MTSSSEAPSPQPIMLPARLDYATCEPLADALEEARGSSVQISAAEVETVSAMPIELLLRARLAWQNDGFGFDVTDLSEAMVNGLAQIGLPAEVFETGEAA